MGSVQTVIQDTLADHAPPLHHYHLQYENRRFRIWDKPHSSSLIEYQCQPRTRQQFDDQISEYFFRHKHPYLVSSQYIEYCQNSQMMKLFYEGIVTNLSKITDIPFGDTIKIYSVALRGFQVLYQRFGYFQISEDLFFVSEAQKIKVWCHKDIHINQPCCPGRGNQQHMVKQIIRIIQENTDQLETKQFQLGKHLYEQFSENFELAIRGLELICEDKCLKESDNLECLGLLKNPDIREMIDLYIGSKDKKNPSTGKSNLRKSSSKGLTIYQNSRQKIQYPNLESRMYCPSPKNTKSEINILNRPPSGKRTQFNRENQLVSNTKMFPPKPPKLIRNSIHSHSQARSNNSIRKKAPKVYFVNNAQQTSHNLVIRPQSSQGNNAHFSVNYSRPPHPHIKTNSITINNQIPRKSSAHKTLQRYNSVGLLGQQPKSQNILRVSSQNSRQQIFHSHQSKGNIKSSIGFQHCQPPPIKQNQQKSESYQIKVLNKNQETFLQQIYQTKALPVHSKNINPPTNQQQYNFQAKSHNSSLANQEENSIFTKPQFWVEVFNMEDPLKNEGGHYTQVHSKAGANRKPLREVSNIQTCPSMNKSPFFTKFKPKTTELSNQFPSVTDISDNISFIPTFDKMEKVEKQQSSRAKWHEQSKVVQHDPNQSKVQIPKSKPSQGVADDQILQDLVKFKQRRSIMI